LQEQGFLLFRLWISVQLMEAVEIQTLLKLRTE
jgi:hypothetical protein